MQEKIFSDDRGAENAEENLRKKNKSAKITGKV